METLIISTITFMLYIAASFIQSLTLSRLRPGKKWIFLLGFAAVCLHGLLLHRWIDVSSGQNLTFFNMLSLTTWLISIIALVVLLIKPIEVLAIIIFPITAISILLVLTFPATYIVKTITMPDTLFHILLSILTFCVLSLAGLLAVLLALQERLLRAKQSIWLIRKLPPLESMETLLFQVISFGFVLLSVVLVTSV